MIACNTYVHMHVTDIVEDLAEAFILGGVSLIFLIDGSLGRDDVLPIEGGLGKLSFRITLYISYKSL